MAWHRHITGDVRHVWPDDDAVAHETATEDCICGPLVEIYKRPSRTDLRLVIHSALDKTIEAP